MGQAVDFAAERTRMVEQLVRSRYVLDSRVRDAFLAVPREAFVRPEDADDAYADVPLPIGRGQTISAPSMIAIMLEEARLAPGEHVLEIGTGSGYHAALVAHIVGPESVAARRADGTLEIRKGPPCAFVPLVGARPWPD